MDWPQSHAKLAQLSALSSGSQRGSEAVGTSVLIQERVCVKRAGQLLLLQSLFSYSLHLQKLLLCRQTTRTVSTRTESQVLAGE